MKSLCHAIRLNNHLAAFPRIEILKNQAQYISPVLSTRQCHANIETRVHEQRTDLSPRSVPL